MRKQYLQPNTLVSPIALTYVLCGSAAPFSNGGGGDPINEGV